MCGHTHNVPLISLGFLIHPEIPSVLFNLTMAGTKAVIIKMENGLLSLGRNTWLGGSRSRISAPLTLCACYLMQ